MRRSPIDIDGTGWIPPETGGGGTGWQPPVVIGGGGVYGDGGIYNEPDIVTAGSGSGVYTLPTTNPVTPVVPMVTGQTQPQTQTQNVPQPPQGQGDNRPSASLQQLIKDNPHLALIGGVIALFLILRK